MKYIFSFTAALLISLIFSSYLAASIARSKADDIVSTLKAPTEYQTIINISEWTANNFKQNPPYEHWINHPHLRIFTNLLSHRYVPQFIRLDRGVIEMHTFEGQCSHMSRFLEFLFDRAGIESEQHDIFSSSAGHSALSVKFKNEWVFVDPFLGFLLMHNEKLISLDDGQKLIQNGVDLNELIYPLKEDVNLKLYENLASFDHAMISKNVTIDININFNGKDKIKLGEINNNERDTLSHGAQHNLSSHLHYIGPRYRRNMKFTFSTNKLIKKTGYDLIFHATENIESSHLPDSNIVPRIEGKKLIYHVKNNNLVLFYGNMKWNLSRIIKRKSWYDIDMIEIIKN